MSSIFFDQKFDTLDWMTQITETIESPLNQILADLPDEIILTYDDMVKQVEDIYHYTYGATDTSVQARLSKYSSAIDKLTYDETDLICDCFRYEVSEGTELNIETKELKGEVKLIKVIHAFEDKVLQSHMGKNGVNTLRRLEKEDVPASRMNDIIEILGDRNEALKGKSKRRKMIAIRDRFMTIMATNEWRIRDTTLADKVGLWIADYIKFGHLAPFTNFCKLKVMTHSNLPIYSIKEEEL